MKETQTDLIQITTSTNRRIIAIILFSFLLTFVASRLMVYLVLGHLMPNFFLTVRGVHIHHFTYGVIILAWAGLYFIIRRPNPEQPTFKWLTMIYGMGLGLTFDEFGMWVRLADNYWVRQSYDAVVIVCLILLNILFYRSIIKAVKELYRLTRKIIG